MTVSASTQIPKTSDPTVFQRQCMVLFECVLGDPSVQEFGSSGQSQKGVDLLGRRRDVSLEHWVGVQCKLTIKAKKLKKGTVREEAEAALAFKPKLNEYIVATTADDDAALHAEAASVTDEQAKLGRDFTVQVWGWQTLQTHILQHQAAMHAFFPDGFPQLRRVAEGQDRISEQVESVASAQVTMLGAIERIELQTTMNAGIVATSTVWDDSSVGTLLDRQIDQYRDMLGNGQPRTALDLLESLWNELPSGVESRIRFRVRANIAACKLRLGNEKGAGTDYLKAYDYAPNDAKAVALKVFGLLLLGEPAQARKFGLASIDIPGDRGPLIAHLIMAARRLPDVDDAFGIIPPDLGTDPGVECARVDYLRFLPEHGSWTQAAREALERHPDNKDLARFAAEAEVADACIWSEKNARAILPPEPRKAVAAAVHVLRDEWDSVLRSEASLDDFTVSLCTNLSIGYRLLHDLGTAMEVVADGLRLVPGSQALMEKQFVIALEQGDSETASQLVDRISPSRDAVFGRLQLSTNAGDWAAIEALADTTDVSSYELDDKAYFESLVLLARCELGHNDNPQGSVADLLEKYEKLAIVPIVLYEFARHQKDGTWASELFRAALSRCGSLDNASRLMLVRIAEREEGAEAVIDLLDGHVDTDRDNEGLRSLARGFVNANVRSATLAFIQSLPTALKKTPFYGRVVGGIHFNCGALEEAADAFEAAIDADPYDLVAHLGLINTRLRQDRVNEVEEHLRQIDPRQLKGRPDERMGLAQLLTGFGQPDVGLAFGYETALNNRDDPRVAQLYIGLILPDPVGALVPSVGPEVQTRLLGPAQAGGRQSPRRCYRGWA